MLTELLEFLIGTFTDDAEKAIQLADSGERPPAEFWRGYADSLKNACKDLRKTMKKAESRDELVIDHLQPVLDRWLERMMDMREEAGYSEGAGKIEEVITYNGRMNGYQHAWRELTAIVEYVLAVFEQIPEDVEDDWAVFL